MTSVPAQHAARLDAWLKDYTDPKDILGEPGWLQQRTKRVVERVVEAELTAPLDSAPYGRSGTEDQNARHGKSHQTVPTDTGPLHLEVARARQGRFLPRLVPKRQRRLEGFDANVLSL
jgi:putative transposase